jgi:hypothetical protein
MMLEESFNHVSRNITTLHNNIKALLSKEIYPEWISKMLFKRRNLARMEMILNLIKPNILLTIYWEKIRGNLGIQDMF